MENEVEDSQKNTVKQEQIHDLLFNREIGWQEIIYDLISTEQLDPWDVNITILSDKYLKTIQKLEEADFFVSSKVLLAAALLLRIKSEVLLNKHIKSIDEILFGKDEQKSSGTLERLELDEEVPALVPKSPMPRFKKVTLKELMDSLNKAIVTENRRIKKEIIKKNALREAGISIPKRKFSIKDKIKEIYDKLFGHFEKNKHHKKISLTDFVGNSKEERLISFSPLLHLENQSKLWLDQEKHFDEIYIWLKDTYMEENGDPYAELKEELEKEIAEIEFDKGKKKRLKKIEKEFENPMGNI